MNELSLNSRPIHPFDKHSHCVNIRGLVKNCYCQMRRWSFETRMLLLFLFQCRPTCCRNSTSLSSASFKGSQIKYRGVVDFEEVCFPLISACILCIFRLLWEERIHCWRGLNLETPPKCAEVDSVGYRQHNTPCLSLDSRYFMHEPKSFGIKLIRLRRSSVPENQALPENDGGL